MKSNNEPNWLRWSREIQSISQIGLFYSKNEHDLKNFRRLQEIAAEMIEHMTGYSKESLIESFSAQPGYATVKVDVRGAVVRNGCILLVQEESDGKWCMPGGWADVGEYPSDMVVREVQEESGFQVRPFKLVGVFDANRGGKHLEFFHAYKIIFLCEIIGGQARTSHETRAVDFFEFTSLPELSPNRTNNRHLEEVQAHFYDQDRQPCFD